MKASDWGWDLRGSRDTDDPLVLSGFDDAWTFGGDGYAPFLLNGLLIPTPAKVNGNATWLLHLGVGGAYADGYAQLGLDGDQVASRTLWLCYYTAAVPSVIPPAGMPSSCWILTMMNPSSSAGANWVVAYGPEDVADPTGTYTVEDGDDPATTDAGIMAWL